MAVAIYDYEALAEPGEEDNLEFEEGDLIEVSSVGRWPLNPYKKMDLIPSSVVCACRSLRRVQMDGGQAVWMGVWEFSPPVSWR